MAGTGRARGHGAGGSVERPGTSHATLSLATVATDRSHAALAAGQGSLSLAAALDKGYSRAFALAATFTLVAFAASFVIPASRPRTVRRGGSAADEARARQSA